MTHLIESDYLKILDDLIAIESVNDNEKDVALYLQKLLAEHDIASQIVNVQNNRANLIAEIGHGKPVLGVCGHMDVVAAGDRNDWDSDPFEMTEKNGELYGRGITDMKSGLAASVIAMIKLHEAGLPKTGTIRLLATMAEEVGEYGSAALYQDHIMDDIDGMVIAEPSGYSIGYAEKGSMDIKFISRGKASHSSMPENGYNAIDPLVAFITEANQVFRDKIYSGDLGQFTFNTTVIKGGIQVNSIPAYAEAEASIRTVPEFDNQRIIDEINKLIKKYNDQGAQLSIDIYMNAIPLAMKADNKLVNDMKKAMERFTSDEIPVNPIAPATDGANLLKDKDSDFPFIISGPGNKTVHKVNESVEKQMYFNFIEIYQELFVKFLEN